MYLFQLDQNIIKNMSDFELGPSETKNGMMNLVNQMAELTTSEVILVDGFLMKQNTMTDFIPRNLPPNVKLIFTCDRGQEETFKSILGDEVWYKVELENFDFECSRVYVDSYLKRFNKVLFIKLNFFRFFLLYITYFYVYTRNLMKSKLVCY